jgi:hypothetical protein
MLETAATRRSAWASGSGFMNAALEDVAVAVAECSPALDAKAYDVEASRAHAIEHC